MRSIKHITERRWSTKSRRKPKPQKSYSSQKWRTAVTVWATFLSKESWGVGRQQAKAGTAWWRIEPLLHAFLSHHCGIREVMLIMTFCKMWDIWASAIWFFFTCFLILLWEEVILKRVSTDHLRDNCHVTSHIDATGALLNKSLLCMFQIHRILCHQNCCLFWCPSS